MTAKSGGESLWWRRGREQDEIKDGMAGLFEAAEDEACCAWFVMNTVKNTLQSFSAAAALLTSHILSEENPPSAVAYIRTEP